MHWNQLFWYVCNFGDWDQISIGVVTQLDVGCATAYGPFHLRFDVLLKFNFPFSYSEGTVELRGGHV
jgi:hypothetical protein